MTTYHVTWDIDVEADTFEAAARQAFKHMQEPGTSATCFTVSDGTESVFLDLDAIDYAATELENP